MCRPILHHGFPIQSKSIVKQLRQNITVTTLKLEMKKWSSQWTQVMQLRKEAWKKCRTSTGFEPVTSRLPVRCSTNWAMKPLTLGAGQLWVHMWVDMFNCGNIWTHNWTYMFNFHFISAVHIGFISYVINTHFFLSI